MVTQRQYYRDAYQVEFEGRLMGTIPGKGSTTGVILDQTCFYPASGGQPSDAGVLGDRQVVQVEERYQEIVHWVQGSVESPVVQGRVDWTRRFDHMQQHTGQHILSQALMKILEAETVSFHLSEESSTIDVSRASLQAGEAADVARLANEVVLANRPVRADFMTPDQIETLELRKTPTVHDHIRIVQVEGFDATPCGGTHVAQTGEVGPIAIRRWERRGQETRIEFLCGWRALRDYQWKTSAINELALSFGVKDRELPEAVARLVQETADHRRALQRASERLLEVEAAQLAADAEAAGDLRIAMHVFEGGEARQIARLASLVAERPNAVALFGITGTKGRLFFSRAEGLSLDMAALLRETCREFGGGGGGQPDAAQGGGFAGEKVGAALQWARRRLTSR